MRYLCEERPWLDALFDPGWRDGIAAPA